MERAAVDADNQIEVIAQTGVWPGDLSVTQRVEPIRVRIGNYGSRPVHVRYAQFRLVSGSGESYAALPPPPAAAARAGARRVITPRFRYGKYRVAPYYGTVYSGLSVHDGVFPRATPFPSQAVGRRQPSSLLTREMVAWAIPEGVLDVYGHIDGYMFFERVPKDAKLVQLSASFGAPIAHRPAISKIQAWNSAKADQPDKTPASETIARVSIPFVVD